MSLLHHLANMLQVFDWSLSSSVDQKRKLYPLCNDTRLLFRPLVYPDQPEELCKRAYVDYKIKEVMTSIRQPELIHFLNELLPPAAEHLPLIYHTSRSRPPVTEVILSITPTQGLYAALKPSSAVFLHRPWGLDRSRLFPSTVVLASHQRLDELLTTGWNKALLSRLGVVEPYSGIVGYKQDPERKMGLVGSAAGSTEDWVERIEAEFGGKEGVIGMEEQREIKALACMNAFDGPIVQRVLDAARNDFNADPDEVLYLTGESRKDGLELAERLNMPVLFAGHRRAELWAVKYIAQCLQERWPGLRTIVIDEPEELRENQKPKKMNAKTSDQKPLDQARTTASVTA